MGGHDLKHPDVPDWRIYRVEDVPELVRIQKNLEARGLRYHWLRNEIYKYPKHPVETSTLRALRFIFFGGFKYGLAAAIVTIFAEKAYNSYMERSVEHDDHH